MFSLTEKPKENAFSSPNGNVAAVGQGGGDYVKQTAYALDAGNPLMESAKRKAMEIANARGLVNSTIGQANAVDAMGQVAATLGAKNADANNQQGIIQSQMNSNLTLKDKDQVFSGGQAALDREQQTSIADKQLKAEADRLAGQQNFTASQAEKDRLQQLTVQSNQNNFTSSQSEKDRFQQLEVQKNQQAFQAAQAAQDRDVQLKTLQQQAAQFGATNLIDQQKLDIAKQTFSQNTFTNYTAQMMSIVGSQLTPEAKKEAQNTLNALYFGEARQTLTNNAGGGKLDPRTLMGV